MVEDSSPSSTEFQSRLESGVGRFLANLVHRGLTDGCRSAADFIRHFPPAAIMDALRTRADLRASILEGATGLNRRIALKKTPESAGVDLQLALDEAVAHAEDIVALFEGDERIRHLDAVALWSYAVEGAPWSDREKAADVERAQAHVAFILDEALGNQLLTHRDIIDGIGMQMIAELLPRDELQLALESALEAGRRGEAFSEQALYNELSSHTLVSAIPLQAIWEQVVVPYIARDHNLEVAAESPAAVDDRAPASADETGPVAEAAAVAEQGVAEEKPQIASSKPAEATVGPQGAADDVGHKEAQPAGGGTGATTARSTAANSNTRAAASVTVSAPTGAAPAGDKRSVVAAPAKPSATKPARGLTGLDKPKSKTAAPAGRPKKVSSRRPPPLRRTAAPEPSVDVEVDVDDGEFEEISTEAFDLDQFAKA